jgi:uncharacterized protein (TIGR04255 family)
MRLSLQNYPGCDRTSRFDCSRTMHYRTNFLSHVVFRLDYRRLEAGLSIDVKPPFSARIADIYPVASAKPITLIHLSVGPQGPGIQQQQIAAQWEHRKVSEGTRVATLTPEFIALEYGAKDFDNFPPFRDEIQRVYDAFQADYHVAEFTRLGLRYINEIVLPEGDALDWEGFLNQGLITSVKTYISEGMRPIRSMHQCLMRCDDGTVTVHYGLNNPDFPNPIVRRAFILDFDCAQDQAVAAAEVMPLVGRLNTIAENLFESSIEDGLRERLGVMDD